MKKEVPNYNLISYKMVMFILVNGKMGIAMEEVKTYMMMDLFIKDNGKIIRLMALVD